MSLISCEINLILTWFDKCMLSNDNKATIFALTDAKLYQHTILQAFVAVDFKLQKEYIIGININWN